MNDWIAKWLIRLSVDQGRTIPAWIQRRMAGCQSLNRYARSYQTMMKRLKSDADTWAGQPSEAASVDRVRNEGSSRRYVFAPQSKGIGWAIASMLVLAASWLMLVPRGTSTVLVNPIDKPMQTELMAIEPILAMIDQSRAFPQQLSEKIDSSVYSLSSRYSEQLNNFLEGQAEQAGSAIGQSLLALNAGAREEQHRIASDASSAIKYLLERVAW